MVPDTFYLSEIAAQLKLPFNDIGPFFCAKKDLLLVVVKTEVFLIGFPVVRGGRPQCIYTFLGVALFYFFVFWFFFIFFVVCGEVS